jgi:hypothetical protein
MSSHEIGIGALAGANPWALAGASIVKGFFGSRSARKAARQRAAAEARSRAEREKYYGYAKDNLNPYIEAGGDALGDYAGYGRSRVEFDPSNLDLYQDPSYQFRLGEQNRQIDRAMAGQGKVLSGNRLEALMKRSGEMASQEYGNAYNRMNKDFIRDYGQESDYLNRLAKISGRGQNAAANLSSMGINTGTGNAGSYVSAGNSRAAGTIGSTNAWLSALGDVASVAGRSSYDPMNYDGQYGGIPESVWLNSR